jgi:Tol biopolymer transport system component
MAAIAPDGSAIVYSDTVGRANQLWIKERGELKPRVLAPQWEGPPYPSFSSDGQWVAFMGARGKLVRVSRRGGAPSVLSDSGGGSTAWLDDGTIVFVGSGGESIYSMSPGGGPARLEYRTSATILKLTAVPGTRAVIATALAGNAGAFTFDLATDSVHALPQEATAAWIVRGTLIYATGAGQLFAAAFDTRTFGIRGTPTPVLQGVRTIAGLPDAALGRDGTLLYGEGRSSLAGWPASIALVRRDGAIASTWSATVSSQGSGLTLSPDGSRVALSVADSTSGRSDVFVMTLASKVMTRLTFAGTQNFGPSWSPDGSTIAYLSDAGQSIAIWSRRADGSGPEAKVKLADSRPVFESVWSPDGKWLVYRTDNAAPGAGDILAVRTSGDTTPVPLLASPAQEVSPAFSPDMRWLAYSSSESGQLQVYVRPFPNVTDGLWQVSTDGGTEPLWSHSGRELFYRNGAGELVAVAVSGTTVFAPGAHTKLFSTTQYLSWPIGHVYAVTRDDRQFLFLRQNDDAAVPLVLMRNWLPRIR